MFGWFKRRRRKRIAGQPTPAEWSGWIAAALPWYPGWSREMQDKAVGDIKVFISEKHWEGCDGLEITPRMQVFVAAQAAMMLTGVVDYCFDGVQTVLLFPRTFRRKSGNGLLVWEESRIGEAWHRGPIVLSWADVPDIHDGRNLVVHELAHHLDGIDGGMSGSPVLGSRAAQAEWERIARAEFRRLQRQVNAGRETLIDPYGASSPAEFFAVVCEHFFGMPRGLQLHHPELYRSLRQLFHADPARWTFAGASG